MIKTFLAIIGKELLEFFRSWGLVVVVLYAFTLEVYVAGNGIEMEAKNVTVGVVDYTNGGISRKIQARLHEPQFKKTEFFRSQKKLSDAIFNKEIMMGLVFESDFEKDYFNKQNPTINVLLDTTTATQSFMALSYLQNIVLDFSRTAMPLELKIHKLFNQNANTPYFMSITEMLSVITLLTVILTAVAFVKEKENGTWDIMLLMPVNPKIIILAKSLSQVIIIMVGVVICVGLILFGVFDVPLNGSIWAFFLLTFFYAFTSAGIGLFIASVAKNTMQVAQFSIVIMMPLIFLSGAWTPIHAMHPVLQKLSLISPLRYYIEGTVSIFFRGTSFFDLLPYFIGVIALGGLLLLIGFRKIGKLF